MPVSVTNVPIDAAHDGQRLDNFLSGRLKGVPKPRIYRLVRRGEVRVNKGRVGPDYRLATGDVVRIPPVRMSAPKAAIGDGSRFEWLEGCVLHDDDALMVINKPAGLAVHAGSGLHYGLIEALRALRPHAPFLELVHRLDRETSGCLMVAKSRAALLQMQMAWQQHGVTKQYLALLKGEWAGGSRMIEFGLDRDNRRDGMRHVRVDSVDGQGAASRFNPQQRYRQPMAATLVKINLLTGRTHQARVHAAHAGHPIAGDDRYGDRPFNRELSRLGLKRLFLHAQSLEFKHPSGRRLTVQAPLPADLESLLGKLQ